MTFDKKRILLISSLVIIALVIVFLVQSHNHAPLFVTSDSNYSLSAMQQKDQNNSAITNSRDNIITETVKS